MSQYTVVADVGMTLVQLLRDHMVPELIPQPELIGLGSPADKGDLLLTVFLYDMQESGERQTQMLTRGTGSLQFPPLTLQLSYLITAHSSAELQTRAPDEHRILGRAMQVLYDHAVMKGDCLQGTLAGSTDEFRIVRDTVPLDTLISLFPNEPYKLSLSYSVAPIHIDSTRVKTTRRVLERDIIIRG